MRQETGLTLNKGVSLPLHQQLFDQIVDRIRGRAFPAGYRLPPTRELAKELGSNRNTIVRVYADLEAAGFVRSTVGRGTFVLDDGGEPKALALPAADGLSWSSLVSAQARATAQKRTPARTGASAEGAVNLGRMEPSHDLVPDALIARCVEHVLKTKKARALGYAPVEGLSRLRELLVADLARQGVPAHVDDVVITTGSQQGLDLIVRALVAPGDVFLVDAATYPGVISVLTMAGARIVPVRSDAHGPDMAEVLRAARGGAKGFYVMPNCNNPTGAEISGARRRELVDFSRRSGVPLLEDDYGSDLWLDGRAAPPALRSLSGDVIYIGTFSKKLLPALRVGFVVAPRGLRSTLVALKHAADTGTSLFLQEVLAEFLERGYLRAHIGRTLPEYRSRRDALEKALARHLPQGMSWRRPERGLVLWLPLPPGLDPDNVFEEARRRGVMVGPSSLYQVEAEHERGLRLTYCAEPPERLALGARRLGEALKALLRDKSVARLESTALQTV